MKVFSVESVTVIKRSENPLELLIHAIGTASSTGWTNPRLDNSADPNPADAVLEFSFDADRPGGITLPVLTPITAVTVVRPAGGADAVIVSARTNAITVHASEFVSEPSTPGPITTFMLGEETFPPTTRPAAEEMLPPTTQAFGEEMFPTTRAFGEETLPTTLRFGEEGGGPWTDPRLDDPAGPIFRKPVIGEHDPLRRGPFGDPFGTF